jgi:hypothetical protein
MFVPVLSMHSLPYQAFIRVPSVCMDLLGGSGHVYHALADEGKYLTSHTSCSALEPSVLWVLFIPPMATP